MAVVLADVVVVVKRCKEERTPCPYISLYTTVPLVFLRYTYIHIKYLLSVSLPPALPSSLSSTQQGQLSTYTTQQPSTHQTAYTCKRQTFTAATRLKYSTTINAYLPTHSHTLLLTPQNNNSRLIPSPPFRLSRPNHLPKHPNKKKMQGGRAEFKKTSRVQCMPPPRGVSAKKTPECNPGGSLIRSWYLVYTCSLTRLHAAAAARTREKKKNVMRKDYWMGNQQTIYVTVLYVLSLYATYICEVVYVVCKVTMYIHTYSTYSM